MAPDATSETTGQIVRLYADVATVQVEGQTVEATIRGKLFREDPPAVGDWARLEKGTRTPMISEVLPRKSELARRAAGTVGLKSRKQVLIANVDQVVVVFSVASPEPHVAMLDRFLVVAEANNLAARIVVNKLDLGSPSTMEELFGLYRDIGYPLHGTSVKADTGLHELREALKDKESVFTGPSGVGKSSLLNTLYPGLNLKVGQVSEAYGKGRHTTVGGFLIHLPGGGSVADTAGLREVGLWQIPPAELPDCFPEFRPHMDNCRFSDCKHLQEPDCAVTGALNRGEILLSRYESYVKLREEAVEAWPRW